LCWHKDGHSERVAARQEPSLDDSALHPVHAPWAKNSFCRLATTGGTYRASAGHPYPYIAALACLPRSVPRLRSLRDGFRHRRVSTQSSLRYPWPLALESTPCCRFGHTCSWPFGAVYRLKALAIRHSRQLAPSYPFLPTVQLHEESCEERPRLRNRALHACHDVDPAPSICRRPQHCAPQ
jgi:hypothetical protein